MSEFMKIYTPNTVIGLETISTLSEAIKSFAPTKVLVLTDEGLRRAGIVEKIVPYLNSAGYEYVIYDKCETEPTIGGIEMLAQKVVDQRFDLLVGIGGGSVMDTTKVVSLIAANKGINTYDLINGQTVERVIKKILIPTTGGSGSEWSWAAVVSDDKAGKMSKLIINPKIYADAVIIDPELTLNLPKKITAETGIDALTHCMEGYYGTRSNVLSDMINGTAVRLIAENLRPAYHDGSQNIEARFNMAVAAALAIQGGGLSSGGLVHIMNEQFSKKAHISHGAGCGLLLPHVMQFYFPNNPEKFSRIAKIMGEDIQGLTAIDAAAKSVEAVRKLIQDVKMPTKLAEATDIRLTETDISLLVEQLANTFSVLNVRNTRPVTAEDVTEIYRAAIWGKN